MQGKPNSMSQRPAAHDRELEQEKWDSYYATLPLYDADETTSAFNAELVERVSELLPIGSRILEAGCGGGWHSLALARTGNFHLTLMDFSNDALAYSRRLFEREQLSAQFIREDVFSRGEPDFDLVFNTGVLEHYSLEEQGSFLRGMASRSRNYVLALVPNRLCYWYWIWRVHKSGKGEWPFGKEVPVTDLSAAFDLAGLKFLGQRVMGKRWTEFFISDLAGMDRNLRDQVLEIHRSPIIPEQQRGYLLAALGSVSSKSVKGPKIWMPSPVPEDMQKAEILAALADALALRIGAEQALSQQQAKALENEQTAQMLMTQIADEKRIVQMLTTQIAEEKRTAQMLTVQIADEKRTAQILMTQIADEKRTAQMLMTRIADEKRTAQMLMTQIADKEQALQSATSELAERERTAKVLSERLSAKDYELGRMTNTLGWQLLSRYGRIKYRYLLPIYRALGLPPYGKKQLGAAQTNQLLLDTPSDHGQPAQLTDSTVGIRTSTAQVARKVESDLSYESNAHDVVCFPIIDWDFRFQRPQQLMAQFAAAGHRVFYIAQGFYSHVPAYTIQEKRRNIYEISLRGLERKVYSEFLDDKARDVLFASLDALRRDLSLGATVAFAELPFWWPLVDKARAEFAWPIVYDCMDYHAGFSTNRTEMLDQESSLLESADLVVVSSEFLETRARRINSNVLLVRNACDYEHFAKAGKPKNERPLIGYYGAIAEWFDSDLVADLAERRPDWDFVLVGSTFGADTSRLSQLSNVSLPGEKHYLEIPDWLGTFDVAIIPFKRTALTQATNPVKAYEILAAGKPLVSVPIPEVSRLAPLVRQASNVDEFETEVMAALNTETREFEERRRAYAREHTWEKRYETLTPPVRNAFSKASIVVVTFNNLALNRLCLESLYARTEWPNFEVIVVDNASSDGTREYLNEAEKTFPNLQVIMNDKNLGFAAANNIGLKQASGDYLVLLNNDTVLTRGWLSALIRHLHADPEIGLVGPVTNEIGNEAKVKVGYKQLEDLPRWAAQFVRDNDGRGVSIPVLAMFCIAMRRTDFERVGLLDERFEIGMFEDDDYARRVQEKGYKTTCVFDSFVHHAGRASFKLLDEDQYIDLFQRNRRIYEEKWGIWEPHIDETARKRIPGLLKQLRVILQQSRVDSRRIIVFLPSIGWKTPLVERPHHLAKELARQGFLVFFDCSDSINDHFVEFLRVGARLWLYKGPRGVLETLEHALLWALPYNAALADRWTGARIIYDFVDDLSAFAYNQKTLRMNHDRMLETADLVLCASRKLIDQVAGLRPDALYIPNGADHPLFSSADRPHDLDSGRDNSWAARVQIIAESLATSEESSG
jgi:GT2 family glycosyltransferase/SAM-dependent methyltransferase